MGLSSLVCWFWFFFWFVYEWRAFICGNVKHVSWYEASRNGFFYGLEYDIFVGTSWNDSLPYKTQTRITILYLISSRGGSKSLTTKFWVKWFFRNCLDNKQDKYLGFSGIIPWSVFYRYTNFRLKIFSRFWVMAELRTCPFYSKWWI